MGERVVTVRKRSLQEIDDRREDVASLSAAERIALAWELTKTAWAFRQGSRVAQRLSRTAVRVLRRRG